MLSNLRASPPLYLSRASVCFSSILCFLSTVSFSITRRHRDSRSSFVRELSVYTWHRLKRGRITSNEGFSVVAPISVKTPCSTAPRSESC